MEQVCGVIVFARVGKMTAAGHIARLTNGRHVHASKASVPTENLVDASFNMPDGSVLPYQSTRSHRLSVGLAEPGFFLLTVNISP
jgi:hypothetical protein